MHCIGTLGTRRVEITDVQKRDSSRQFVSQTPNMDLRQRREYVEIKLSYKTGCSARYLNGLADVGPRESAGNMWIMRNAYRSKALNMMNRMNSTSLYEDIHGT
jgi:hypothetical protein